MSAFYSADTDELDEFADQTVRDAATFDATLDGLTAHRAYLAGLPLPSFVESRTLDRYRDLVSSLERTVDSQPMCRPHSGPMAIM